MVSSASEFPTATGEVMSDNLPINTGDGDDDGLTLGKILLGAGGLVVGLMLLIWVFNLLVGLVGFLIKWGIIAALLYGGYRLARAMMGSDSSSSQGALPEEEEDDYVLEEMSHEAAAAEDPLEDDLEKEFAELEREMND